MLGAIIGDIVGSVYEFHNIKTKDFNIMDDKAFFTDDSVMTCAVAKALLISDINCEEDVKKNVKEQMLGIGRPYPNCGYGGMFYRWMYGNEQKPYNSYGNGSAMRVSAAGWVSDDLEIILQVAKNTAEVTHNHQEGIGGAQATAGAILLSRQKKSIPEIKKYIEDNFYNLNVTLDEIRADYSFNETCQDTVPQAIVAFLESTSFEDAIRNAISLGGDSDTLAAITGSIAEAYYGIPNELRDFALSKLDENLKKIIVEFETATLYKELN